MITDARLKEALENCSRDPIHIPGAIQSYGVLVATDKKLEQIEFASETTTTMLGIEPGELLGESIDKLLDREQAHRARNALSHRSINKQREVVGEGMFLGNSFQISIHSKDDRAVLEFMPMEATAAGEPDALDRTRALLADSIATSDLQTLLDHAVDNLRAITGYERVLACRFLPDGAGHMVSESRASHVETFLGLRFPATDIPPIARKLIAEIPVRVVANAEGENVAVLAATDIERPLDMSLAILRGTVDVQLQYLRNMGVKGNMTLPIIVEGNLWGLFALHHTKALIPDPAMLIAAELSGKMLSLIIQHTVQTKHQSRLNNCTNIAAALLESENGELSEGNNWDGHRERLSTAIPSQGIAFIVGDEVIKSGDVPTDVACLAVLNLTAQVDDKVQSFDDLAQLLPTQKLNQCAGALVMTLSESSQTSLILFRNVISRTINWAGAPEKKIIQSDRGLELSPRNSFAHYAEQVEGKSDEWSNDDLEIAEVLHGALVRVLEQKDREETQQHRLKLMVRELNHRVRNILTLVQSLSSSSKSTATSMAEYALALEKRIVALAGAHDLLTKEDMRGVEIGQIAKMELQPYLDNVSAEASINGPHFILNADVSPIITLLFHELVSNAVKYGALSVPQGKISLQWSVQTEGLVIEWRESNGPEVTKPKHEGLGLSIIEDAIPYEFGGQAELVFDPSGVVANFVVPRAEFDLKESGWDVEHKNGARVNDPETPTKTITRRGLIVEDNYLIAKESQRWFKELGFHETISVATVSDALRELSAKRFDFCLLDVNLRGDLSEPVAHKLVEKGIPYIFASGYGSEGSELCNQFNAPFLTKPLNISQLREAIEDLSGVEC